MEEGRNNNNARGGTSEAAQSNGNTDRRTSTGFGESDQAELADLSRRAIASGLNDEENARLEELRSRRQTAELFNAATPNTTGSPNSEMTQEALEGLHADMSPQRLLPPDDPRMQAWQENTGSRIRMAGAPEDTEADDPRRQVSRRKYRI